MRETKESLESVSTSLETLQEGTGRLQVSLQSERASLSNTLNDWACSNEDVTHTCNSIRGTLNQLALSANFNGVTLSHNTHRYADKVLNEFSIPQEELTNEFIM